MFRIICVILFLLLVNFKSVSADVGEEVKEYNKKTLPPAQGQLDVGVLNISVTPDPTTGVNPINQTSPDDTNSSYQYSLAELTEEDPWDALTFFQRILSFFKNLFGITKCRFSIFLMYQEI